MSHVVTCVLEHQKKILLLKRSDKVRTYQGWWGSVAGYVEPSETPKETAYKEISQEIGLSKDAVLLKKQGKPISFSDFHQGKMFEWVVHPFLFSVKSLDGFRLDWEHVEARWITPSELSSYELVPRFDEVVKKVYVKV